ncbi:hypothetical protein GCM10010174_78910 [Kutzneria viridogrisea]
MGALAVRWVSRWRGERWRRGWLPEGWHSPSGPDITTNVRELDSFAGYSHERLMITVAAKPMVSGAQFCGVPPGRFGSIDADPDREVVPPEQLAPLVGDQRRARLHTC